MTGADDPQGPVLAVVGPTASGKSRVALEIALTRTAAGHPTELVAVDAFTVYRGMDLGTAKPTAAERAQVPHHLIDVLDPGEVLSVAAFRDLARAAIAGILARGATPLLVGGSGLYFRAVVDPLRFPPTDPQVRARLERRWADDPAGAHAEVARCDPVAAERIGAGNLRRSVRALEVWELTGEPFSAFDDSFRHHRSIYAGLEVVRLDPATPVLRAAIEARAVEMAAAGLVEETARLHRAGPLSTTAAQAIGYAEAAEVLAGTLPPEELAAAVARRTWRYARRQRSWFRSDPRADPVDAVAAVRRLTAV